jgi:flagellar biosynthesis chaperone FliJ
VKRFRWALQRVFDVKQQRQRALRSELFMLAQEIAQVREAILYRRTRLRGLLEEMAGRPLPDRIADQGVFMQFVGVEEEAIRHLTARRADLEAARTETHRRFLEVRATCKMLARLREQAYRRYLQEVGREEQKLLDEAAHVAHARKQERTPVTEGSRVDWSARWAGAMPRAAV